MKKKSCRITPDWDIMLISRPTTFQVTC